jgi:hypothetical protein
VRHSAEASWSGESRFSEYRRLSYGIAFGLQGERTKAMAHLRDAASHHRDVEFRRCCSMVAIAHREGIGKQYVSRLIRLAFLAPSIVERIVEGRQPPELTAQALRTGHLELPLAWEAQRPTLECARSA